MSISSFNLFSPEFPPFLEKKHTYNNFGCHGENLSPELHWSNAPENTKSFALTFFDPDAKTGSGWWHWILYNIPSTTKNLPSGVHASKNNLPNGSQEGPTDFGVKGYAGPCPPVNDPPHHYIFTLFALKIEKISLPENATAAMIGFYIHANAIASTTLMGQYSR